MSDFWAAHELARDHTRRQAIDGAIEMARQFRRAYGFDPAYPITVRLPRWMFGVLTEQDRIDLANDHDLYCEPTDWEG